MNQAGDNCSVFIDRCRGGIHFDVRGQESRLVTPMVLESEGLKTQDRFIDRLSSCGKPVAYLHGDTHFFRIDKPLFSRKTNRAFQNFTRVETFGAPESHWVRITVDPADPQLFRFKGEIVPGNTVNGEP